jgi:hypothetical protein
MFGYAQAMSSRLQASAKQTVSDNAQDSTPTQSEDFPPYIALRELTLFIQSPCDESPPPSPIGARAKGKQKVEPRHHDAPLIVLALEEAHTTTQRHKAPSEEWSIFNELRHALWRLRSLPLFSLFM